MIQKFDNQTENAGGVADVQKDNIPQISASAQNVANPYVQLESDLQEVFGNGFKLDDPAWQDLLLKQIYNNREQNEMLADALERDPRLAQMLADMLEGRRNAHSAMARYFGRSLLNIDEDSPEYEEMMMADEERREEVFRLAQNRREYEENLEMSRPVIESFCKQHGYDPSDFMELVWEQLVFPILSGTYSYEVCTALDHALTYDRDVENAFAAGDVKGRNTSIRRMKEDLGDGMPKGMSSVAPETSSKPRSNNSLLELALNA